MIGDMTGYDSAEWNMTCDGVIMVDTDTSDTADTATDYINCQQSEMKSVLLWTQAYYKHQV